MVSTPPRRVPLTQTAHRLIEQSVATARAAAPYRPLLGIDATAGNGHDTLFLARLLGSGSEIAAFDIQPQALTHTATRLHEAATAPEAATTSESAVASEAEAASPHVEMCSAHFQAQKHGAPAVSGQEAGGEAGMGGEAGERGTTRGLAAVRLIQASHAEMLTHLPPQWRGTVAVITFNLGYLPGGDKTRTTATESTLPALDAALQLLAPYGLLSVLCYRGHPEGAAETDAIHTWLATLPPAFSSSVTLAAGNAPTHAPMLLSIRRIA